MSNDLIAFFFIQENKNDPDADLDQAKAWTDAQTFILAVELLLERLDGIASVDEEAIQTTFYDVGKIHYGEGKTELRSWFRRLYLLLFKNENGPRWGVFVSLIGKQAFIDMLRKRMEDPLRIRS